MKTFTGQKTNIVPIARIVSSRAKIPAIFRRTLGIFRSILEFLFIYSATSCGTAKYIMRNPG